MQKPLPLDQNHWRSRWLVLPEWDMLHRVAEINWGEYPPEILDSIPEEDRTAEEELAAMKKSAEEGKIEGIGKTICGKKGYLRMPGIFSRLELQRCPECCKLMNVPGGKGNPFNAGICEEGDVPKEQS